MSAAAADDEVGRGPAARWVQDLPVPQPRAARMRQVANGVYDLLSDTQVRPDGAHETFFSRSVYLVTDRNGLEQAARVDIDYDPAFDHVVLNRLRVLRGGKAYDRLPGANVRLMERESDSDSGIFDGVKTVHVEIDDVEVGDIVDVSYSWESRLPFWPDQFFASFKTEWSVPLEMMRYRVLWPAARPLTIRNRKTALKPVLAHDGTLVSYEWRSVDGEPVAGEDGTPDWYPTWGSISLSSFTSWGQVVDWAMPRYAAGALPAELAARVDAIARKYPKPGDRITEAVRLVEDDLRYVSLSIGNNSFRPRSPAETFRSGYGDCKDKSALLVAMLRRLGVEAYVALTDTKTGPVLPQMAPAANIYDHAIVEVRLGGRSYWIDPTSAHAGGRFPDLAPVDYGWALPIAPGQTSLEHMPKPHLAAPNYRTVERYELSQGSRPALRLGVVTTYTGAQADSMRNDLANKSLAKTDSNYLNFYVGMYPGLVREKPLAVADDRDANRLVTVEAYRLPPDDLRRGKLLRSFPVKASSLDAYDKVPSGARTTPYQLPSAVNKEHTVVLVTPGRRPPAPPAAAIDGAAFRYALNVTRSGDTLTLDYRLAGRDDDVLKAPAVPGAANDADAASNSNRWNLDLTSMAGGTIGDETGTWWRAFVLTLLVLLVTAALLAATAFAVRHGLRADDAHADDGFFFPVHPAKFLLMGLATAGLYAAFWLWKSWRWQRRHGQPLIQPFWRAVFGVFWLYALFRAVDARGRVAMPLRIVAIAAAFACPAWVLLCGVLGADPRYAALAIVLNALSFVWMLPIVVAVNRLNAAEILRANSRVTDLTGAAAAGGLVAWVVVLVPALAAGPWKALGLF
ncbi:MAG: DUF3857 domain-containing transglutaminase family protein [Rhizomicrobium sp.]